MPRALKVFQDESLLDDIQVASPCSAEWADMVGSDTVRFCASCQKNVYNLSGMRRDEALDLLRATEGRLCVRFYRRGDGTVLTEDCPVGVRLALRRARRAGLAAAAVALGAVAAMLAVLGGSFAFTRKSCEHLGRVKAALEHPLETPVMGAPPPMPMLGEAAEPVPEMGKPVAPPAPHVQEVKGNARTVTMGDVVVPRTTRK